MELLGMTLRQGRERRSGVVAGARALPERQHAAVQVQPGLGWHHVPVLQGWRERLGCQRRRGQGVQAPRGADADAAAAAAAGAQQARPRAVLVGTVGQQLGQQLARPGLHCARRCCCCRCCRQAAACHASALRCCRRRAAAARAREGRRCRAAECKRARRRWRATRAACRKRADGDGAAQLPRRAHAWHRVAVRQPIAVADGGCMQRRLRARLGGTGLAVSLLLGCWGGVYGWGAVPAPPQQRPAGPCCAGSQQGGSDGDAGYGACRQAITICCCFCCCIATSCWLVCAWWRRVFEIHHGSGIDHLRACMGGRASLEGRLNIGGRLNFGEQPAAMARCTASRPALLPRTHRQAVVGAGGLAQQADGLGRAPQARRLVDDSPAAWVGHAALAKLRRSPRVHTLVDVQPAAGGQAGRQAAPRRCGHQRRAAAAGSWHWAHASAQLAASAPQRVVAGRAGLAKQAAAQLPPEAGDRRPASRVWAARREPAHCRALGDDGGRPADRHQVLPAQLALALLQAGPVLEVRVAAAGGAIGHAVGCGCAATG